MKKVLIVSLVVFGLACGGSKPVPTPQDTAPSWLKEGTGAINGESGKRLQGVGSASGQDPKERRTEADGKARAQLAQTLETFLARLTRLSESTQDNLGDAVAAIGKKSLASAQIMDHYVTTDGTETAICVLELQAFKAAVQKADGDGKLQSEMAANADRAFDQQAKQ